MAYRLEGSILEVCNCNVLCPCWIGEKPDTADGTCDAILAYHFDNGTVDGVDVSGLTLAILNHIPGNVLDGNFRVILCVDDRATPEQEAALISVYKGEKGGPVGEFAQLFGEVVGTERAPITFEVKEGKGRIAVGDNAEAELEPYIGATGRPTTLVDTIFSTIAGAPAYVSKAPKYRLRNETLGIDLNLQNHNAIQGKFLFEC